VEKVIVRYKVKPECVLKNEPDIRAVFEQLGG